LEAAYSPLQTVWLDLREILLRQWMSREGKKIGAVRREGRGTR